MDRDQAIKIMHDLLDLMVQRDGSDLFITAGFHPPSSWMGRSHQWRKNHFCQSIRWPWPVPS